MVYAVEGQGAKGQSAYLSALLVQDVGSPDVWIVVGRADENYIYLETSFGRSYAAALTRLANVGEGIST
jgi:hypothetical protein